MAVNKICSLVIIDDTAVVQCQIQNIVPYLHQLVPDLIFISFFCLVVYIVEIFFKGFGDL